MTRDNGIEVEGLVREFKNGPRAVDGIDLRVEPGEIYGFLGPNGAGKSTTVLMLTTLLPPTAGTARVAGHDIVREGPAVRAAIGAALQEAALDPLLTGREHMRLQTTLQGVPKAERRPRGDALIERVGLADAADRKVGGYSGGMKRRLDLALALVHRPRILFLDEPTTGPGPLQPRGHVEGGLPPGARRGRDGVPHHAVPRGGRRAGRPDRDHRPRPASSPAARRRSSRRRSGARRSRSRRSTAATARTVESVLARFGSAAPAAPEAAAVRLRGGAEELAAVVRALDAEDVAMRDFQLHAPTLDDVFLAKTGRKLDAGDEEGTGEHPEAVPA